jgi:hypothetical protein
MICRAASAAADRTAGPIDGVVDEPAEIDAYGPRAESPRDTRTRSSGNPSSSAAICAIAVREPVPMSCIAVITVARPSEPIRTHSVRGRPAAAVPDLAREPDAVSPRPLRPCPHFIPAGPVRLGAAIALEQVLGRVRTPVDEIRVGMVSRA